MGIRIKKGGFLTTVQDRGIVGYMHQGIGISGAADQRSYRKANLLVDNRDDEAVLEMTMMGPVLEFVASNVIAITGGSLTPKLNGAQIPMYRALAVRAGDLLELGAMRSGCRAYISFAGGLDVPVLFGSRSTYMRCTFGGVEGRKLEEGDEIPFLAPQKTLLNMAGRVLPADDYSSKEVVLRVVLGPQDDLMTPEGIRNFQQATYTVTREMDRVGVRLTGEAIGYVGDGTIVSDGLSAGAIQVPPNGQPIVMLSDCATTGGYNKIATVISVDVPLVAQATPGTKMHFVPVGIDEAEEIYLQHSKEFAAMDMDRRNTSMNSEWTVHDVKELMAAMGANNVGSVRINGPQLELSRFGAETPVAVVAPAPAAGTVMTEELPVQDQEAMVHSPIIGTFYAAPSPEESPYVTEGSKVAKGDVLCIVESMKMMNEVVSERDGVIAEILVKNEEEVEYGQPLFRME